jgi:signal transduction histidine kinase
VGVSVTDQGIGMTDGQLKRVFESFYRADASGKITGPRLGVNIAKKSSNLTMAAWRLTV